MFTSLGPLYRPGDCDFDLESTADEPIAYSIPREQATLISSLTIVTFISNLPGRCRVTQNV